MDIHLCIDPRKRTQEVCICITGKDHSPQERDMTKEQLAAHRAGKTKT